MHASFRTCLPFALLVLAACSPKHEEQTAAPAPKPVAAQAAVAEAVREEEKCTNEPRTDENDKRPRCGGMGRSDTKKSGYRIDSAECPGGGRESMYTCDITKPFTNTVCGGLSTVTHTPADESGKSGTWTMHVSGQGGTVDASGSYTLSGGEERMTESVASGRICVKASGRAICTMSKPSSATWTRIDDCDK